MIGLITPEFRYANYAEAALWVVIAVIVATLSLRRRRLNRTSVLLAVALLAFGASDIVEARTGAWWRPWWLLVWKGACLLCFLAVLVAHLRARRSAGQEI